VSPAPRLRRRLVAFPTIFGQRPPCRCGGAQEPHAAPARAAAPTRGLPWASRGGAEALPGGAEAEGAPLRRAGATWGGRAHATRARSPQGYSGTLNVTPPGTLRCHEALRDNVGGHGGGPAVGAAALGSGERVRVPEGVVAREGSVSRPPTRPRPRPPLPRRARAGRARRRVVGACSEAPRALSAWGPRVGQRRLPGGGRARGAGGPLPAAAETLVVSALPCAVAWGRDWRGPQRWGWGGSGLPAQSRRPARGASEARETGTVRSRPASAAAAAEALPSCSAGVPALTLRLKLKRLPPPLAAAALPTAAGQTRLQHAARPRGSSRSGGASRPARSDDRTTRRRAAERPPPGEAEAVLVRGGSGGRSCQNWTGPGSRAAAEAPPPPPPPPAAAAAAHDVGAHGGAPRLRGAWGAACAGEDGGAGAPQGLRPLPLPLPPLLRRPPWCCCRGGWVRA